MPSHRLSTIINADRILVIHDGKIVEEGSHKTLLDDRGHYYRLWGRQGFSHAFNQKDEPNLIDISDDSGAAVPHSGPGGGSHGNPAQECISTAKKIWKPDAPEFIPCKISRWKPTPIVQNSTIHSPGLIPYPTHGQPARACSSDLAKTSKFPVWVRDSKENAPAVAASTMPVHDDSGISRNEDRTESQKSPCVTHKNFYTAIPLPSGGTAKEPTGCHETCTQDAAASQVVRPEHLETPRYKRRHSRRNLSKSDPVSLNDHMVLNQDSALTLVDSQVDLARQLPREGSSPGDNSASQRRRRRNRHSKSRSPRKPLAATSNGGPKPLPENYAGFATPPPRTTLSVQGFPEPRPKPAGIVRFPPGT